MDKIFEVITDFEDKEENVRDLWDEVFHYYEDNKYSAHNLVQGYPQNGDTILWQQLINKQPNTMGWAKHTMCYPPEKSTHMRKAIITGIAVIDVKNDMTGGTAEVLSGGVGAESVKIKLKAEFWRGFSFQVIVIGKYLINNNQITNDLNVNKESKDRKISFNINLNQ